MPRIKKKKDPATPASKKADSVLILIFFLLLIQTVFLVYKNRELIKDIFRKDPNRIYRDQDIEGERDIDKNSDITDIIPENIRISVLNGCGVHGLAGSWKENLRKLKFDVRETGNASRRYDKTIILSRTENMSYAHFLAEKIGVSRENVLMQLNRDLVDIDLTLILGSDYKELEE
ncbi:MAG: LytR C-terminal domain-containing protein [Candidatus Delongbacteria bacterium]